MCLTGDIQIPLDLAGHSSAQIQAATAQQHDRYVVPYHSLGMHHVQIKDTINDHTT